jgi:hypothetical protein
MPDAAPQIRKGTVAQISITASARVIKAADLKRDEENVDG